MKRYFSMLQIAYEGRFVIAVTGGVVIIVSAFFPHSMLVCAVVFVAVLCFFRDPVRMCESNGVDITSPADGVVMDIEPCCLEEGADEHFQRIGIFLSVFNVHRQRMPFSGHIVMTKRQTGSYYPASNKEASAKNESNLIVFSSEKWIMAVRQISGIISRRNICTVKTQEVVKQVQPVGFIMFGSRVELYVPRQAVVLIKKNDHVVGGKTIVARF
jgi:phosphatidylserine decarboxylase